MQWIRRSERALVGVLSMALVTCAAGDGIHDLDDPLPRPQLASLAQPLVAAPAAAAPAAGDRPTDGASDGATSAGCPVGMRLVEGAYCPNAVQTCKRWLDPPGRYHEFRCAEYAQPATCKAPRKPMRFCIDADEQRLAGSADPRPSNHVSWLTASSSCEARGARLCTEHEWTFACEGEEMRPYPYGFVRDAAACNIDRGELGGGVGRLVDHRTEVGANRACTSPFGVRDLAGNLEEWTVASSKHEHATLLKGSWWLPGRSTCRAANGGHDAYYQGTETGFRCCR